MDEHHAVTLVLETPPAILQDDVVALNFAVATLENRPFAIRGTSSSTFDEDHWELIPDVEYGQALRIKDGILRAEAVAAIIVVPSKWTFDCGEFTQACQMYACLRSIGAGAYNREAGRLTLRLSESPGRGVFERLYREFGITATGIVYGDVMRRDDGEYVPVEQALDEAPIGSTVTWTNPNEPEKSAWHNENTLKLGADSFHAHGLPAHQYTRKDFEAAYRENTAPGDVYVTRLEFVRHRGTR